MTPMSRELALKQPAEVVVRDQPAASTTRASRSAQILLRLAALLFVLAGLFQMWCAATGYRL